MRRTPEQIKLAEDVLQHIKDNPSEWFQQDWIRQNECGTVACFAGWACLMSGGRLENYRGLVGVARVPQEAIKLLGLAHEEADVLFAGSNTLEMLEMMVKDISNGLYLKNIRDYFEMTHDETFDDACNTAGWELLYATTSSGATVCYH